MKISCHPESRKKSRGRKSTSHLVLITLVLAAQDVTAADYHVGPGQTFASIGAVPWESVASGDTIYIHSRPEPYREKIFLSQRGTMDRPVRIIGVPGPEGQKPVIDGENATTSSQFKFPYSGTASRGLVIVSRPQSEQDGYKPKYIEIEGLELRNASPLYNFQDAQGASVQYRPNAASIFIERGENITVRNCTLTGSGNGFFVASSDGEEFQSRDILLQGSEIFGNGNANSDREHNIYTSAIGMVFEFNRLGPLRPGAFGNNLKDRSAGTVVRYNWIEGGAQQLDLVDAEDSFNLSLADPRYRTTYVYGNVLINQPTNASVVHYGGDSSVTDIYRKGTLYFYHNTVIFRTDQRIRWRVALLRLDTNDESADVRNNIFYNVADTAGAPLSEFSFMQVNGKAQLGVNWVSEGWFPSRTGASFEGSIVGTENLLSGTDPGFVSFQNGDFTPGSNSVVVDRGQSRAATIPEEFDVLFTPLKPGVARIRNGAALDLGAMEAASLGATLSMQRSAQGQLKITLAGPAGNYRIDLSNDLKSWQEAMTVEAAVGNEDFILNRDASAGFYRAVLLPAQQ